MKKDWPTKTLGEVCQFRGGGTPSKAVESFWRGDIPWVSPKDMKFDVVSDSIDHISEEAIESSATSLIPKDSVLIVVRSGILARTVPIAITGRNLTINQDLKALCPNGAIDARFLYHLLDSKMDVLLCMVSRGATVHRLITEHIRSLDFILPPLPEQQRIVGILDEAFDGIASAKTNAEKNLQNARALFDSHLQSVFTQHGEGWVKRRLGDIASVVTKGTTPTSIGHAFVKEGINFVKVESISSSGDFLRGKLAHISPECHAVLSRSQLYAGDILFSIAGALGRTALVPDEILPANTNQALAIIRLMNNSGIFPEYVFRVLATGFVLEQVDNCKGGVAQQNLSLAQVKDFRIPVPPLPEQQRIVGILDALREQTQHLESIYQQKLAALGALKKSLLHQAFRGQL
jgi:type I restriction enzyme S subunit